MARLDYIVTALVEGSIAEVTAVVSYPDATDKAYEFRFRNPTAEIAVYDTFENRNVFELHAPSVGCEATYGIGSDSYAGRIVKVSPSGKKIAFAHEGSEVASFEATLRSNGRFRPVGSDSGYVAIGYARDYRDPSF